MNNLGIVSIIVVSVALWLSPIIIARKRRHLHRLAITVIALFLSAFCPVKLPCLLCACWPKGRNQTSEPSDVQFSPSLPAEVPKPDYQGNRPAADAYSRDSLLGYEYHSDE